jgi:hypothetical protein
MGPIGIKKSLNTGKREQQQCKREPMKKLEGLLASMNFDQCASVSTADIQRHERNLKLRFGPEYKQYVSKYGCVAAGPNELYGLCGDNASIPSAIHATTSARRDSKFPRNLLVIADDGRGRKFCIDSNDEIFVCDRDNCVKIDQSFEDFAIEWLRG